MTGRKGAPLGVRHRGGGGSAGADGVAGPGGLAGFGAALARARAAAGLTQEQLAEVSGVSVRSINHLEHGRRRPYPRTVCLLADALGLVGPRRVELVEAARSREGHEGREGREGRDGSEPLPTAAVVPAAGPDSRVTPRQLPATTCGFAGRVGELAALHRLRADAADAHGAAAIGVISGMAGVGKTALALHWAHYVAEHFPDGQLYLDLRGFCDAAAPATASEAIGGQLDALGLAGGRLPEGLAARAALYRSALANRRMLIVLDNAVDAGQIRPLLPGGPHNLVVVTSRNQLASLIAVEGARSIDLDVLGVSEARTVLVNRIGGGRAAAEPDAVEALIERCAGLPLALGVVAAIAQIHPARPLARMADELRAAGRRLAVLNAGDPAADVRTVFSWSYRRLDPVAARVFRLLGPVPGPGLDREAAAALTGLSAEALDAAVMRLTEAHLLGQDETGRLFLHDLLRDYAAELAGLDDADAGRPTAWERCRATGDRGGQADARDSLGHPSARPAVRSLPSSPPVPDHGRAAPRPRFRAGVRSGPH